MSWWGWVIAVVVVIDVVVTTLVILGNYPAIRKDRNG